MILLVMGMGRSGTSLLMQVLNAAGFDCGGGFIADNENNPRGYFEIKKVMNFNISIIKQATGDEDSLYPIPKPKDIEQYVGTPVPMEFPSHNFAVKDPRFSVTLPIWEPYLKTMDCRILFSRRNPEAIAESMARAYHIDLSTSRTIINEYIRQAEENIARFHFPTVDVVYDDWFTNPSKNIERIESLTGRELNVDLSEVLDIDLQHCKGTQSVSTAQDKSQHNLFHVITDAEKENLLTIETVHPKLFQQIQHLQLDHKYELIQQDNGDFIGKYQQTNGQSVEWSVPSKYQTNTFPSMRYKQYQPKKQWLFLLGIDALCPFSLNSMELSPFSPIIIVEPDHLKFVSYLKTHSYIHLLKMPQIYWFVGENAFKKALLALDNEIKPYFTLEANIYPVFGGITQSGFAKPAQQFMAAFQQKTRSEFQSATQQALALKHKFENPIEYKKALLVIPAVSCWVVLGQGLAHGLQENGIEVIEYQVSFPPDKINPYDSLELLQAVREISPDFIVTLSHPSDIFIRGIEQIPIKRIVWYVDEPDHLIQKEHGQFDDVYYCWDEFEQRLQNRNGNLKEELLIGAFPLPHIKIDSLACEVGFVGSINDQSVYRNQIDKDVLQQLDHIVEQKLNHIKSPIQTLIDSSSFQEKDLNYITNILDPSQQRFGMTPRQTLILFLHRECIRRRRIEVLSACSDFDLNVYGNADWEYLLRDTPVEGAYQGMGLSSSECCNFYASSIISLNIHPPYLHNGPNPRDIDIPMCDGFLLSDMHHHATDRMNEFFEAKKEIALYNDASDIHKIVEFYLQHSDERKAITNAAKERIQKDHMFSQRVQAMLKNL